MCSSAHGLLWETAYLCPILALTLKYVYEDRPLERNMRMCCVLMMRTSVYEVFSENEEVFGPVDISATCATTRRSQQPILLKIVIMVKLMLTIFNVCFEREKNF